MSDKEARDELAEKARDELVAIIAHEGSPSLRGFNPDDCTNCSRSRGIADAILEAGYRKISDDPETVELLARALYGVHRLPESSTDGTGSPRWGRLAWEAKQYWRTLAAEGLRALRGGDSNGE